MRCNLEEPITTFPLRQAKQQTKILKEVLHRSQLQGAGLLTTLAWQPLQQ